MSEREQKYEKAMASFAQMEKRAFMAESMLEATLQYESGQNKASSSPRPGHPESPRDNPTRRILPFGLGWRDRNKGKQGNDIPPAPESRLKSDGSDTSHTDADTDGQSRL